MNTSREKPQRMDINIDVVLRICFRNVTFPEASILIRFLFHRPLEVIQLCYYGRSGFHLLSRFASSEFRGKDVVLTDVINIPA